MSNRPIPQGGSCAARFESLRELFKAKLESGEELGASLAVNIGGEMVVDLSGGTCGSCVIIDVIVALPSPT